MEELPSVVGNDAPGAPIKYRVTWAELVARTWCGVGGVCLHLKKIIKNPAKIRRGRCYGESFSILCRNWRLP